MSSKKVKMCENPMKDIEIRTTIRMKRNKKIGEGRSRSWWLFFVSIHVFNIAFNVERFVEHGEKVEEIEKMNHQQQLFRLHPITNANRAFSYIIWNVLIRYIEAKDYYTYNVSILYLISRTMCARCLMLIAQSLQCHFLSFLFKLVNLLLLNRSRYHSFALNITISKYILNMNIKAFSIYMDSDKT